MRLRCAEEDCETRARVDSRCFRHRLDRAPERPKFPTEPLAALVEARGGLAGCGVEPHSNLSAYFYRARKRGWVSEMWADHFAHHLLSLHPCEVWPDWFSEPVENIA